MNNKNRVITIGVILAVLLSLLLFILPVTAHLIIAYVFALLGILCLVLSAIFLTKDKFRIPQDIPYFSTAWTYLIINLFVSILGVALAAFFSPELFLLIHVVLLAAFVIRIVVLSAGKEYIDKREDKVAEKVFNIRMMLADLDSIKEKTADLHDEDRDKANKELTTIYDALRYSDPMSHTSLQEYDNAIKESIILMDRAVNAADFEQISTVSIKIQRQIKDRNNRVKLMK